MATPDNHLPGVSHSDQYRTIFEQAGISLLLIDSEKGIIADCNQSAISLFQYETKDDLIGKHPSEISPQYQPDGVLSSEKAYQIIRTAKEKKRHVFEWVHKRLDGTEFPSEILLTPISINNEDWILASVQNISDQKQLQTERDLLLNLAFRINSASDFKEALSVAISEISQNTEALFGEAWYQPVNTDEIKLAASTIPNNSSFKKFQSVSRNISFTLGEGLPGEVWKSEKPVWISDIAIDQDFIRSDLAKKVGLKSGLGVPVLVDNNVVAVLCFYLQVQTQKNNQFKNLITSIATQLGGLFHRKLYQDALKKSEQNYKELFEDDLNANFIATPEGLLKNCNTAYVELFGFESKEEALNSSFNDRFTNYMHQYFFWEALKRKGKISNHEMSAARVDGKTSYITVKVVGHYHGNQLKEIVGYIQDITDRKKAEKALQKSEERYSSLIETTNDWIWEVNESYHFTYSSFKVMSILGFHPKKIIGTSLFDLMPMEDEIRLEKRFKEISDTQSSFVNIQHTCFDHLDNEIIFETSGVPVFDDNGIFIGYRGISRDITKRKKSERKIATLNEELEQKVIDRTKQLWMANKELESFSYSVSHDLRAPLRSIDGFSKVIMEDYGDSMDEKAVEYLNRVRKATQRMSDLINSTIKLTKVSQSSLSIAEINLSEIAKSVNELIKQNEPNRNVEFQVEEDLWTHADKTLMEVALQNLIGNAWKFTSKIKDEPAKIEFGKKTIDGTETFYIKDNGAGFNMEYAKKLFAPFQRLHKEADFEGTGIGLATVQRIIHRHMGSIWAEGEVDKGATFYFTLDAQ